MKVLHVLWDLGHGGAQAYVRDLIQEHLASGKVKAEVLTLNHMGVIANEIESLDVPVKQIGMRSGFDLISVLKLFKYLQRCNSDILHSHSHNFAFNWLLGRIHIPKVYTEHGGNLLAGRLRNRWAHKLFGQNYCKLIAISEHMAQVMRNANVKIADKIYVVYNGIDVRKIDASIPIESNMLPDGLVQAKFKVGVIGRLVHQKGIDTFLEAAAIIARARNNTSFAIVGDGPLRYELLAKADQLGIAKRVFFLGFRQDASRILKVFDVFLFTSNYEPFGLVLTEAMAARVPLVALSLKGAVGEIIKDGVDGFVVEKKEPALLANMVVRLLEDQNLGGYFTRNARKKVEQNFTIEQNAKKVFQIYMKCLEESTK